MIWFLTEPRTVRNRGLSLKKQGFWLTAVYNLLESSADLKTNCVYKHAEYPVDSKWTMTLTHKTYLKTMLTDWEANQNERLNVPTALCWMIKRTTKLEGFVLGLSIRHRVTVTQWSRGRDKGILHNYFFVQQIKATDLFLAQSINVSDIQFN